VFFFCIITGCAPVLVPAKVIHALNLNIDDFNGGRQPRFSNDFSVNYGELIGFFFFLVTVNHLIGFLMRGKKIIIILLNLW
jgi:hypothetical protein